MSSQALPIPFTHPYCVWSENRLGNYGNLELSLSSLQRATLVHSHFLSKGPLSTLSRQKGEQMAWS